MREEPMAIYDRAERWGRGPVHCLDRPPRPPQPQPPSQEGRAGAYLPVHGVKYSVLLLIVVIMKAELRKEPITSRNQLNA